jgi:hypothetical protein
MAVTLASRLADASAAYKTALGEATDIILTAPELYLYDREWAQRQAGGGRLLWSALGGVRRGARPFPVASADAAGSGRVVRCGQWIRVILNMELDRGPSDNVLRAR